MYRLDVHDCNRIPDWTTLKAEGVFYLTVLEVSFPDRNLPHVFFWKTFLVQSIATDEVLSKGREIAMKELCSTDVW